VFIDLRDREGVTQLVFDPEFDQAAHEIAGSLRAEWCIGVTGEVRSRGTKVNDKMTTGTVEVWVKGIEVFSKAETPPFAIEDDVDTNDTLRLKYRYLDLRRPKLQKNLMTRRRSRRPRATSSARTASSRSRRRSWSSTRQAARGTFSSRRGSTRAASTHSPSRRRSSSSC